LAPGHDNLEQNDQLVAMIKLTNISRCSARNPALRLEFNDSYQGSPFHLGEGWFVIRSTIPGASAAVQWDGRCNLNLSIHGDWSRPLPQPNLRGLYGLAGAATHEIRFGIVADGFKKEWTRTVDLP
jgi:hypothetical protein